jgi:hypothetical protein
VNFSHLTVAEVGELTIVGVKLPLEPPMLVMKCCPLPRLMEWSLVPALIFVCKCLAHEIAFQVNSS